MRGAQRGERYACHSAAARRADADSAGDGCGSVGGDDVARLIFTKGLCGGERIERRANAACECHFRNCNNQPAIGNVVNGGCRASCDQRADVLGICPFRCKIDVRRIADDEYLTRCVTVAKAVQA